MHPASEASPRYLLAGPEADVPHLRSALGPLEPFEIVTSPDVLLDGDGAASPGWILVAPETDDSLVIDLLHRIAMRTGSWSVLLLRRTERGLDVLPLSPGFLTDIEAVASRFELGGADEGLLSLRHALGELSRIRHDINNPLTAALAESQLALMDLEPGTETEASVKAVEEQLRRIRDLVAELTAFRAPAPRGG